MTLVEKACEICNATFLVKPYRATGPKAARFCSHVCGGVWHGRTRIGPAPKPWAIGNQWRKGKKPAHSFPKGHEPWNKGVKGLQLSPGSQFKKGQRGTNAVPVGTVRERADREGNMRAHVKIAEPNKWRPRALVVWEAANGPLPRGMIVHHENRDTLDDQIANLVLLSRADHLREHRAEFETRRAKAATEARWGADHAASVGNSAG